MTEIKRSSVLGTLAGQFVGDALGTTLEFKSAEACKRQYPHGLREIVGSGPFGMKPGQVTDDGELAITLARCLVAHGADRDARARAYAAWARSGPPDMGHATRAAFGGWPEQVDAAEMLEHSASVNGAPSKQANGALMRISPLALYAATMEPARAVQLAREDARFSHPSEVCQVANGAFVSAIQVGLHGGSAMQGWEAACAVANTGPVLDALNNVKHQPTCDGEGPGWVLVALRMAFHQLLSGRSFEDALVSTVMAGGDADTNGAITGALLGAFHGFEAIPSPWWSKVQECRPGRPSAYHVHDALALAERLVLRGQLDNKTVVQSGSVDGTALRQCMHKAGGQMVDHDTDPALVVVKIPLEASTEAHEFQKVSGVRPLCGVKNFVFPMPRAALVGHAPKQATNRTSETDPINVNWLPNQGTAGEVGLTFAPGKHAVSQRGKPWARDLAVDLDRLRNVHGVDLLVCLLEDQELERLKIPHLVSQAVARGMTVHRLPIRDGGRPPLLRDVQETVAVIRHAAQSGKKVVIHCQGGLGRAGTIGGCYLRACGVDAEEALRILVRTRGKDCPENEGQRDFIREYR